MTQIYTETGEVQTVTVIRSGPCTVLQVKTPQRDGYEAVQLGFEDKSRSRASRSERGHVAAIESKRQKARAEAGVAPVPKAGCEPQREIREFRTSTEGYTVGQVLDVSMFDGVGAVDVTGTSKGRGTAGVMKRHGFHGQRASHGAKQVHRQAGSTGCNTSPARIFKGRRMAGRYGAERVTTRNLRVVAVDLEEGLLLVRGAVPGHNNGVV
ncbi:MAG: 50S ribosomal protein L3, partial [Planctomycetia bacterium]|nr:50S ribosomal protein L3 [Planctomycetia bacterium]